MGGCCGEPIPSCDRVFDRRTADDDLRRLREDGPAWATRTLIDLLGVDGAAEGSTILDVGAGVGAVHLALLERGAGSATDVDGSAAYLEAARSEAGRRDLEARVSYRLGDLVDLAPSLDPADLVALDRVVCCYPDAHALLGAVARLAARRLGLVYPRDTWWIRLGVAIANPFAFRGSGGYRMRVHPSSVMEAVLRGSGLERTRRVDGRVWRVELWERPAGPSA